MPQKSQLPAYLPHDGVKRCVGCVSCDQLKPQDQYYFNKGEPASSCKACSHGTGTTARGQRTIKARMVEYLPKDGQRKCTECEVVRPLSDFPTYHWNGKDHPEAVCKVCGVERSTKWNKTHPEKRAEISARYSASEKGRATARAVVRRRRQDPVRQAAYISYQGRYAKANAARLSRYSSKRQMAVRRDPIKGPLFRARQRKRYATDPRQNTMLRIRARLNCILKQGHAAKASTTRDLLGCTWDELVEHMEAQFKGGMSWANKGEWVIDHIRPLSAFDFDDPAEQRKACHYSNLQPLWAAENLKKSDWLPDGTRGRHARHRAPVTSDEVPPVS